MKTRRGRNAHVILLFAFLLVPAGVLGGLASCNQLLDTPEPVLAPDGGVDASDQVGQLEASTRDAADASPADDVNADAPADVRADAPAEAMTDAGPGILEIISPEAGLARVTGLVQENGFLYGSNNSPSASTGPVWKATTTGADFAFIAPYDANVNGKVASFVVSDPDAFYAIDLGSETGAKFTALDGSETDKVVGFYQGVVLAADPPNGPHIYISDGRTNGFDVEPKTGNPNPENPPTLKCNRYPEPDPAPLQILVDDAINVYWAYNGTPNDIVMGQRPPPVQSIRMATAAQVLAWGNTGCVPGQWTELVAGVDVTGIGIDGSYVYYADTSEQIWRVAITGGAPVNLTANVKMPNRAESPSVLYLNDDRVYWAPASGNIWAIQKDGTSSGTLKSLVPPGLSRSVITALAFDQSYVYFVDNGDGSVWRLRK